MDQTNNNTTNPADNQRHLGANKITITAINVNSLITNQKRYDLLELAKDTNSDVILISETKFNSRHQFNPTDYNLIRTDRPTSTAGGGTAILIKNHIEYEHIRQPTSFSNKLLEYTIIKIPYNNINFFIISIYATNDGSSSTFIKELVNLLNGIKAYATNSYYIMAGDPNIKSKLFGNTIANQRGRAFDKWELNEAAHWKFKFYPPYEPTFLRNKSFLDVCFADERLTITNLSNSGKLKTIAFDSDHKAISFKVTLPDNLLVPNATA